VHADWWSSKMYYIRYRFECFEIEVRRKKNEQDTETDDAKILLSFIKPDGSYKKQYNSSKVFIDEGDLNISMDMWGSEIEYSHIHKFVGQFL
jgi:hypothetical protein